MMRAFAFVLVALVIIGSHSPGAKATEPPARIHYSPAENLERVDVALIDSAKHRIDMAAYVLTDYPVIWALRRAAVRGVRVRILRTHADDRYPPSKEYLALGSTPGIEIREKRSSVYMHLKSYSIDGRVLRSGAANFSPSGLKRQENDLIILESPAAATHFEAQFAGIWRDGEPSLGGQAENKAVNQPVNRPITVTGEKAESP